MLHRLKSTLELNNIVFIVAIIVAALLIWNTVSTIEKNFSLQTKVDKLEDEVALLELENENLSLNNEYYKTDEYLELAARDVLGKVRPGENVLILPDYSSLENRAVEEASAAADEGGDVSNFEQWLYFLFRRTPS